jgi:dTDP-glucose pyrophosphorylase
MRWSRNGATPLLAWTARYNYQQPVFRQMNKEKPRTHHDALEFPDGQTVLLLERQEATVLQFPTQMWVSTAPVVSGSDVSKHLVRVARRFAGTVDEMNSGAGRTPQRDVCQAFVVQAVIVKPSLHVLASCGAAVKYGSHGYALGRFSVLEARKPCAVASFSHM